MPRPYNFEHIFGLLNAWARSGSPRNLKWPITRDQTCTVLEYIIELEQTVEQYGAFIRANLAHAKRSK